MEALYEQLQNLEKNISEMEAKKKGLQEENDRAAALLDERQAELDRLETQITRLTRSTLR